MFRFLRFLWKVFILASVFGIGYIIGREHSFEEEEDWDSDDDTADATTDEKKPEAGLGGEKATSFEYADGKATSVAVVGDFNDWNKEKNSMKLENGAWKCEIALKPGRHEYKFVVNNTDWMVDPKCAETAPDKHGGRSSVITVV